MSNGKENKNHQAKAVEEKPQIKVIAEVGSNIKNFGDCMRSAIMAKEAGADIVKFQYFTGADLYGPLYDGARDLIFEIEPVASLCERQGIEFMCTAFSPDNYKLINPFVRRHKVASSEITALDILETVNSFRKPVILSCGGADHFQIRAALLMLRNVPVTLLYCEVAYPAKIVDLRNIDYLKSKFGQTCAVGYSDHSIDVLEIPKRAQKKGATIIEKHVNFCGYTDTPDAPHSLNFEEFKIMVRHLKGRFDVEDRAPSNPYQRKAVNLPNGKRGYFRPMPNAV